MTIQFTSVWTLLPSEDDQFNSKNEADSIPDEILAFFNWHNPSSRTMTLGSTQALTEMSTGNLPGGKGGRPARMADNLTSICEPTV
jgi:hypothetical protein